MSANEIIAELPKLRREELERVGVKLRELLNPGTGRCTWGEALLEVAGSVDGLPPDYAENHDHHFELLSCLP